eukprot:Rhum_TRINITY_DN9007_c1_g1::Rhum_TRINITY_DN9007_c1_g1_i1::g.31077::m.31077
MVGIRGGVIQTHLRWISGADVSFNIDLFHRGLFGRPNGTEQRGEKEEWDNGGKGGKGGGVEVVMEGGEEGHCYRQKVLQEDPQCAVHLKPADCQPIVACRVRPSLNDAKGIESRIARIVNAERRHYVEGPVCRAECVVVCVLAQRHKRDAVGRPLQHPAPRLRRPRHTRRRLHPVGGREGQRVVRRHHRHAAQRHRHARTPPGLVRRRERPRLARHDVGSLARPHAAGRRRHSRAPQPPAACGRVAQPPYHAAPLLVRDVRERHRRGRVHNARRLPCQHRRGEEGGWQRRGRGSRSRSRSRSEAGHGLLRRGRR